jgi:mannose-6-phosphate isomerase-like protein (cupin superfamily)
MINYQESICKQVADLKPFAHKGKINNIFSWQELANLLNTPLSTHRFHAIGKECKAVDKYNEWQTVPDVMSPQDIYNYARNHVCYIQDSSRASKRINKIAHDLEWFTGFSCDAHVFFSVMEEEKETDGFGMHKDVCHNLIVQVEGTTKFTVQDHFTMVLEPGDCVFVPLGVYHKAESIDKRLSVSFPMNPTHKTKQNRFWIDF